MEAVLLCSKVVPRATSLEENRKFSFRHLNKHLKCISLRADSRNTPLLRSFEAIQSPSSWRFSPFPVRKGSWVPPRCSISSSTVSDSDNPFLSHFRTFSFGSVVKKVRDLKVKPMDVVKLTLLLSILTVAAKKVVNLVLDPFFWMYFSWTWLFWPWFIAVGLAGYGIYCFRKHWLGEANAFEQLGIVTSVFTWLTLVPPAYFNGYLEGWPYVFFLAYHYFFFFNVSVRKRLYGDYYARTHDPKWDVNTPLWSRILFGVGIMVGHWLAAFEGPELHRLPGGWANVGIWILIVITMLMHYDSTLYLARYSEKVVVPTAVVQFGPYRWVRHPIYASTMLLFAAYCTALRAPLSLLFLLVVCLVYYNKKAKLEEELMVESFGQSYLDYADKMDSSANPDNTQDNMEGNEDEGMSTRSANNNKGKRKGDDNGDSAKSHKKLQTRSWVWDHYTRKDGDDNQCKCHYCKRFFACSTKSGTSNLKKHLDCCKQYLAWKGRNSQNVINQEGKLQDGKVSEEVFREATNEMLVLAQLPLSFVESVAWKHLCSKANLYKPHSRRTATRDILLMNMARKASLKDLVSANKRRVSLTTDIWTAQATGASYMVITVHFIDEYWRLRKFNIGFKYITDHKGATISRVLLECLTEWGIERIFTITVDNATANTSALRKFQRALQSQRADSLVLNGEFMHMRCAAHIINLIVKEGLHKLGDHVEAIRNGVLYVRSSTSRCDSFEQKVVTGKMTRGSLPLDVKTRWNSTYLMLTKAIKFKMAFDKMEVEDKLYNDHFLEVDDGKKRIGPPTTVDWREVERLVKFLGLFYTATLVVSASSTVCSYKCYGEIVTIEKSLVAMTHSYDKDLREKAVDMREKFDKYWDGQKNINRMLIIASVFDPRQKMQFANMCFEKLYGKDTSDAKEMYNSVYDVMKEMLKEYSVTFKVPNTQSSQSNPSSSNVPRDTFAAAELNDDGVVEFERMDSAWKEMVNDIGVTDPKDELDIYLKEEVENPKTLPGMEWDVLSWWRLNSHKYPVLSEIARDVLAMQVSSVASESAFSTSGRLLEPSRSCLTHYMVESLVCLEQWLKSEIKLSENTFLTNAQLLADIELFDKLEKEFQTEGNLVD